ncbi:hypothetical protein J7L60_05645 [Candidatus Bathyarchaeota archaeon]|nr:hypothetical protein [Candidatus Bathyarchaeota archaeon]
MPLEPFDRLVVAHLLEEVEAHPHGYLLEEVEVDLISSAMDDPPLLQPVVYPLRQELSFLTLFRSLP